MQVTLNRDARDKKTAAVKLHMKIDPILVTLDRDLLHHIRNSCTRQCKPAIVPPVLEDESGSPAEGCADSNAGSQSNHVTDIDEVL